MERQLLERLYEAYGRELYLYVFSLCHQHSMAEDILQETFLKAILSLPNAHTNMRAWLYLVARNLCFNAMRKEKHMLRMDEVTELIDKNKDQEDLIDLFLKEEKQRLLYKALSQVSKVKCEILMMQYFGELSQKEIAAIMHLTPENVRVLAYRAKKELKLYLEANGYDIS